jgi:hypothetical protein
MKHALLSLFAVTAFADVVTLKDGRQISCQIESGTPREIQIRVDNNPQKVAVDQIRSIEFATGGFATVPPTMAPPPAQIVTLPVGTEIAVRTIDLIDSKTADPHKEYAASLDAPVAVNGVTVLPTHTKAVFRVTDIKKGGLKSRASLSLSLIAVTVSGQRVGVETSSLESESGSRGKSTGKAALIGGVTGGVFGVLLGGGNGAVVGATVGAASGVIFSRILGSGIEIPPETRFTYRLAQPAVMNIQAPASSLVRVSDTTPAPAQVSQTVENRPAAGQKAPVISLAEPEILGAVYLQDQTGKLVELERIKPRKQYVSSTFGSPEERPTVKGAASPVRVKSGQRMLFVVRLSNGIDPGSFSLLALENKKRYRWIKADRNHAPLTLSFNVTKFGEASYGLTPAADLVAGEYAFVRQNLGDFYCFGVGEGGPANAR